MIPIQHPSNNAVLAAPPGVAASECRALAITRVQYPDGMPAVRSYWRPSQAELAALAAGAVVQFECWGSTHPPIAIGVDGVEEAADDGSPPIQRETPPRCPHCGDSHQVWRNQITGRWTCHRIHCHREIDDGR